METDEKYTEGPFLAFPPISQELGGADTVFQLVVTVSARCYLNYQFMNNE